MTAALKVIASASAPAAPYPPDTRAKGWRFELDYERIEQSDTWALAEPQMRPWLLLLWLMAWRQTPCGSLPAHDELIAARIGMERRMFAAHRDILMRGWWLAADGRMYHPTITEQVLALVELRTKNADKVRKHRDDKKNQRLTDECNRLQTGDASVTNRAVTTPEPEPEPEPKTTPATVSPSPVVAEKIYQTYHPIPVGELSRHVGKVVKLRTTNGTPYRGTLDAVMEGMIRVTVRKSGGSAMLSLRASEITETEVLY